MDESYFFPLYKSLRFYINRYISNSELYHKHQHFKWDMYEGSNLSAARLFFRAAGLFSLLSSGAVAVGALAGWSALASTSGGTTAGSGLGFSLTALAVFALARVTTFASLVSRVHVYNWKEVKVFDKLIINIISWVWVFKLGWCFLKS